MARGCHYTKLSLSMDYPSFWHELCIIVLFIFVIFVLFSCSRWSFFVDVPLRHKYIIISPVLSTCPLHTNNSACGKERRILV